MGTDVLVLLAWSSAVLAVLPLLMLLTNLPVYRRLPVAAAVPADAPVAVLIPARDEAGNIGACLRSVLATSATPPGGQLRVYVLDDHSSDGTAEIVRAVAAEDARVTLLRGLPLPDGWHGKMYACHQLLMAAKRSLPEDAAGVYLFIDADVRLAEGAPWRLAAALRPPEGTPGLLSGVPRQEVGDGPGAGLNMALVHNILTVLLGYLPMGLMRVRREETLAGACGQLIVLDAVAAARVADQEGVATVYAALRSSVHDGLDLPRLFRRAGYRTALRDLTNVATCRMYTDGASAWRGFRKNAHVAMGSARALPVWTVLLLGGHALPWVLLAAAGVLPFLLVPALTGVAANVVFRGTLAMRFKQPWTLVPLHAVSVLAVWLLQVDALQRWLRGQRPNWRGRTLG